MKTDLSKYDNSWYKPGNAFKKATWYFTSLLFFQSKIFPFNGLLTLTLKLFGAKIGKGSVIKPGVRIKYPWKFKLGNYSWIGEDVWIDNLDIVSIGDNVCISQGAMLECGNHNYSKASFDLMVAPITIEDGAWIGAKSFVGPGTICKSHSVLAANSRAINVLEEYSIYSGVPATKIKRREIE